MTLNALPPLLGGAHFGGSSFQGNAVPLKLDTIAGGSVAFTLTQRIPPTGLDLQLVASAAVQVAAILQSAPPTSNQPPANGTASRTAAANSGVLPSGPTDGYATIANTLTQLRVASVYPQSLISFLA